MMRLAILLCLLFNALPASAYQRIVSINLCIDQMLYQLVDKKQIASLTFLAADADYSVISNDIEGIHLNRSTIEDIVPHNPDLILTAPYSNVQLLHFLQHLELPVVEVPLAWQLDQVAPSFLTIGKLLDQEQHAQAIIDAMNSRQNAILAKLQGKRRPKALILAPGGFTHGKNTLKGDLLELAQFENVVASHGINGHAYLDLETVIAMQPEFLILEDETRNRYSLQQQFLQHPALRQGLPNTKLIDVPPALWACATPTIIDALAILAANHPEA